MTDHDNEAAHGLQAGAVKQRIDSQCCGSCPGGCVVQAAKPVPPAVCEFAVSEREQLLARIAEQAREIERLTRTIDASTENELTLVGDRTSLQSELAALKSQPSGVVPGEFTKGDTDNSGDDGKFEAGIHHLTIDATEWVIGGESFHASKEPETWFQRIVVYGNNEAQAEALRDRLLAALNASAPSHGEQGREVVTEGCAPGTYALRYRDNWDGEGDIYHVIADKTASGEWVHNESGTRLLQYKGDAILAAWLLTSPSASSQKEQE